MWSSVQVYFYKRLGFPPCFEMLLSLQCYLSYCLFIFISWSTNTTPQTFINQWWWCSSRTRRRTTTIIYLPTSQLNSGKKKHFLFPFISLELVYLLCNSASKERNAILATTALLNWCSWPCFPEKGYRIMPVITYHNT